jgi:hypothetical protein
MLGVYVRELVHQTEAAKFAVGELNAALVAPRSGTGRAFAAVQSLLAAAAMISKILWHQSQEPDDEAGRARRQFAVDRAKALRSALVLRSVPVLESRKVRNALEHFDERLDGFFMGGHRIVVDQNIGPRESMIVIGGEPPLHLRLIDPARGTISVLEDEVVLQDLYDAISDIGRRAEEWLAKPRS